MAKKETSDDSIIGGIFVVMFIISFALWLIGLGLSCNFLVLTGGVILFWLIGSFVFSFFILLAKNKREKKEGD